MMTDAAITFAVSLPSLLVAHHVGDHWVQTSTQALGKAARTWSGACCCARHVASYTATTAAAQALVWALFGLAITPIGFLAGQMLSALSHYWADRRFTLAWLARMLRQDGYYHRGGGAYELDQSFHRAMLFVSAVVTAVLGW